jgi:RNA polymerase-binding transcription factor DksA
MSASPVQARDLREVLVRQRDDLRGQWQRGLVDQVIDDDLLPARQHVEDALVEVDLALQRMRCQRFGLCIACGGAIELERLIAHPAAARCWNCQQLNESTSAAGDRSGPAH